MTDRQDSSRCLLCYVMLFHVREVDELSFSLLVWMCVSVCMAGWQVVRWYIPVLNVSYTCLIVYLFVNCLSA